MGNSSGKIDFGELMPGGVNSPVRSFASVGAADSPIRVAGGEGAHLMGVDGQKLIDYVSGWGSIIVGHANPVVTEAISRQVKLGTCFGMTTNLEAEFASKLAERTLLPMSRAVNSGTEATMTALRLARGHTGRDIVIKFAGCYHGHSDSLLVAAGSGGMTFGQPDSLGVSASSVANTLVLPYNDCQGLQECLDEHTSKIAAVILEPVAGNMNLVMPSKEFMQTLATGCAKHGIVLISDEVMTGLRATPGLAIRDIYGIEPDLACLGKAIGGGMPVAALCGGKDIMRKLAPTGKVYQAGTLSGNPAALAAGLAAMSLLDGDAHRKLERTSEAITGIFTEEASKAGIKLACQHIGGMWGYYLLDEVPTSLAGVQSISEQDFNFLHREMINGGVLLPPSRFEACFLGLAHDDPDVLEGTRQAARQAFAKLAKRQA